MNENIETGNLLSCEVKIKKVLYPKNQATNSSGWYVVTAEVVNIIEGKPKLHPFFHTIMITGVISDFNCNETYKFLGKETYSERYNNYSYQVLYFGQPMDLTNEDNQRIFLTHILTENQVSSLYDTYKKPFEIIKNEDVESLVKVKGIGTTTALNIIKKYKDNIDLSDIYVKLNKLKLTKNMIDKLIEKYHNPQTVISKIKENPYILTIEVDGIGWEKADKMALQLGIEKNSPFRISSFIIKLLHEEAQKGNSYVDALDLTQTICDVLEIDDMKILADVIKIMYDKNILWHDDIEGKATKVGLMKYYILEQNICNEIKRIKQGKNDLDYSKWEEIILETEKEQGWNYTDEQKRAIKIALDEQIVMITGGAGTGKTSVVNGIIKVLNEYDYKQCALSGKASSRMKEVTGEEGYTIHRLLGFKPSEGFYYNKEKKLPSEIIIVDEISMVGGSLFYKLISAINTNSKLILIGDVNQLESIGCMNLAKDILESEYVPSVELTKIHRQAKKSGIITESKKVNELCPLFKKGWIGHEIRGKLKDFELDIYKNKEETVEKCLEYFKRDLSKAKNIMEIQVLAPIKERGNACVFNLNNKIQEYYNPHNNLKNEVEINISKNKKFIIRENDKIMIMKNDYEVVDAQGKKTPIFNGQQGIVESIDIISECMYISMPFVSNELILLPKKMWSSLSLGYATTIAKSQGSQFEYVIGCIDYSTPPMMLTKELIYTLMTRASKHCNLLGESNALYEAMTTSYTSIKKTFLKKLLDK